MITKEQAKIGMRVKWQSIDASIPPSFGSVVKVTERQAFIRCDFPDPDTDSHDSDTYLDNSASCWFPA